MKKIVKPFFNYDEWTMTHNVIIDDIMPKLSGSAWKVLTVIIRKTKGFHKECDELSFSQIKEKTGIKSSTTVSEALKDLERMGIIKVDRPDLSGDDPARFWKSNIYSLNLDFEVEIEVKEKQPPVQEVDTPSPKNGLPPSPIIEPPLVQKMDTQKKEESINKESKRGGGKPAPLSIPLSIKAYQEINNRYPNKATWEMIAQTVGETPKAIDFWEKVIVTWIGCDFNPRNVSGMLDCFKRNELPTTKKKEITNGQGKYGSSTPGDRPKQTEREAAATDAVKSRIQSISRTGGHNPQPEVRPLRPILDPPERP